MNAYAHYAKITFLIMLTMLLVACQPVLTGNMEESVADGSMSAAEESEQSMPATSMMTESGEAAMATVTTRSLRVRAAPEAEAEVIYGLSEGDVQPVMELSDDGEWVRLAIDGAPDGSGWVSANLVSINGALPTGADAEEATSEEAMEAEVPDATAGDTPVEPPESGFALVVTDGTRLRVREAPSVDSEIAGYIYNGETYPVLATSDDELWIQIPGAETDVSDNVNGGWVAVEFMLVGE